MSRRWISRLRRHNDDTCCGIGVARKFSYESLQIATKNFSKHMLIGEGGAGKVYKGTLSDGTAIVVKKFLRWRPLEELLHKVGVMSHIRHQNIAHVIGFCIYKDTLLIVSEHVPNGSLLELLEDPMKKQPSVFNWDTRAAMCIGIARGLSYLHTDAIPRIIHLDIKPENIVLDHNFTPKIIDFDGSKLIDELKESKTDQVSGTYGYLDPILIRNGKCSDKSDVFSFGVVMLEIICGRTGIGRGRNNDPAYITRASKLVADDKGLEIIDPVLTDVASDVVKSFINVAFLCIQVDPKRRPSMLDVWQMLYGVSNSSRLLITRPDMSAFAYCWGEGKLFQTSVPVNFLTPDCNSNPDVEDTTSEGQSSTLQRERSTGVNLLALTCTSNLVGGQSSISLSSTVETSTTHERLHPTMAFKKHSAKCDFPEAVYPPYITSAYHRRGSIGFQGNYRHTFFP